MIQSLFVQCVGDASLNSSCLRICDECDKTKPNEEQNV